MPEPKENESFFRKVVRFVANPGTDWTDLGSRQEDARELELEKSELKAMIERKRRNDFVRKREFDMLRKVRREGLSPEQLAALGGSSKLEDSELRIDSKQARPDSGVKAKIDEIEQQMVGDNFKPSTSRRPPGFFEAPTRPAVLNSRPEIDIAGRVVDDTEALPALRALPEHDAAPAAVQMANGLPPLAPVSLLHGRGGDDDFSSTIGVEVSEVVQDPDLDEPVIAFANADFSSAEGALQKLTSPGGARAQHAETWLVLFDLYRATGQQLRFESLALDYAHQFGWSAPQWFSLPQMVAEAASEERPLALSRISGEVSWMCPPLLDTDAVTRLRTQTLQTPLPWVFDWSALKSVDAEAAMQLSTLFRVWAVQPLEMRWLHGERLFGVLREAAPTGVRDADPVFWLTRLEGLRLANRADQFDETAIDYCVTYEVSPPSWEAARCHVHVSDHDISTRIPASAGLSEVSTSFLESRLTEDSDGTVELANVELSGQLVGDIGSILTELSKQLGDAPIVNVSCARLIRVDFIAAGDLLNWVLSTSNQSRVIQFVDAHRLLALFFGAMGINEHAKVQVRRN